MLNRCATSYADFIRGFDLSQQFCKSLNETLKFIESKSGGPTRLYNNYKEHIEKLEHDVDALRDEQRRLRKQLDDNKENYGKARKLVDEVKEELSKSESKMTTEEQNMLRDLFAKFPSDAEDEK